MTVFSDNNSDLTCSIMCRDWLFQSVGHRCYWRWTYSSCGVLSTLQNSKWNDKSSLSYWPLKFCLILAEKYCQRHGTEYLCLPFWKKLNHLLLCNDLIISFKRPWLRKRVRPGKSGWPNSLKLGEHIDLDELFLNPVLFVSILSSFPFFLAGSHFGASEYKKTPI